jgi:hypothetical protein
MASATRPRLILPPQSGIFSTQQSLSSIYLYLLYDAKDYSVSLLKTNADSCCNKGSQVRNTREHTTTLNANTEPSTTTILLFFFFSHHPNNTRLTTYCILQEACGCTFCFQLITSFVLTTIRNEWN